MDLRWPLRIAAEWRDGVLVLTLTGRLGAASAVGLKAAAAQAIGRGDTRLVIDLAGVDYVSSAGLRVLAEAARECASAGGALVLCGVVDAVRLAVDLGGLAAQVAIEPTRDLAIGRVATTPGPARTAGH
jgi:anti-anti-sigma factor